MSDQKDFVVRGEGGQEPAQSRNRAALAKEWRNLDFSGKLEGLGENLRRLQCPGLGTGDNQIKIDLQLFQGRSHLAKAPPTAAGQIALFVG